ncbi:E3 ubiquitin-protein ligase FANCL [Solenopsis invicta]|uniref:E3 ubiquitin-protein ligase FANCL n=1 Tax=Solenopsis invicta TaxID=13686 RepID=UPI000595D97B|nr:E3 ubiquitin-protein ligase FANCL [Solenopsis invicta]XP_039314580.1 E3 ubiquitin-protein ligase FANCL [Solenopsis invicta]XP_039314582.1 E3 ubiquitin-protein ligase FANCL [Solenopsis invicta]
MAIERQCSYEEILKCHPEMTLVSKSPVTWQGYLLISSLVHPAGRTLYPRVWVKLVVPNFPSLSNVQLSFGKHIAFLRNKEFSREVNETIKSVQTVVSFLTRLESLILKYMQHTSTKINEYDFESTKDFLQDMKTALQKPSDVQLSCDRNLSTIKLTLRGISLTLQRCNNVEVPWKVVPSDISAIPAFEGFQNNLTNLSVAMNKFKWQVELLERAWEHLKEIDENCWVIDPLEPNKSHMYRCIHLSQSISVTITIDPMNPTALPTIKFFGSDNEVKRQKDDVSNNIHNWNPDHSILENLRMLLNMYEFPEQQDSLDDSKGIFRNRECGICFFEKSETDELPNKICNNERCMKHFHSACLSRWLQTNAANQVVFGHIHGNCPHCKENISCPIE